MTPMVDEDIAQQLESVSKILSNKRGKGKCIKTLYKYNSKKKGGIIHKLLVQELCTLCHMMWVMMLNNYFKSESNPFSNNRGRVKVHQNFNLKI